MARVSCSCNDPQRALLVSGWPTAMVVETQVCPWYPQQRTRGVVRFLLGLAEQWRTAPLVPPEAPAAEGGWGVG